MKTDFIECETTDGFDTYIVGHDVETGQQRSSSIHRFMYNKVTHQLIIEFASEGQPCYTYSDVPAEIVAEFADAESFGKFFYRNIRNTYNYIKIGIIE